METSFQKRLRFLLSAVMLYLPGIFPAFAAPVPDAPLVQRPWFLARTEHFNIYGCGPLPETYKLAGRLEQFCNAYSVLAGTQAVASPPVVVLAFPDHESMKPFLPQYHGQPENLAGFFIHGTDENMIVLSLPNAGGTSSAMNVIYHEYAHLLFRRNDHIWPLWMKEGMAEIYSTFVTTGDEIEIARPIDHHLRLLAHEPWMPLRELFSVTPKSPQYNEGSRQGIFYAESWLLADFLMAGSNPVYKERFGRFTELLREGQLPEPAFTNALGATLPVVETQLRAYLARGRYVPLMLKLPKGLSSSITVNTTRIAPVEAYFRLGDELLRIHRLDASESYFTQGQKLAPASPAPYEGLGLLAAERDDHVQAVDYLKEALAHGSASFLAHYIFAREKYRLTGDSQDRYRRLTGYDADLVRNELKNSIRLMPDFGPAHELLGFFEMVQGNNLVAQQHLREAVQLEPENRSYLLTLAEEQLQGGDLDGVKRTLQPLLLANVDEKLRVEAQKLIDEANQHSPGH